MDSRGVSDNSSASCSKVSASRPQVFYLLIFSQTEAYDEDQRHHVVVDERSQSEVLDDTAEASSKQSSENRARKKVRKITARKQAALDGLDLDAIFRQKATELEEEIKEMEPEEEDEESESEEEDEETEPEEEETEEGAEETEGEEEAEKADLEKEDEETNLEEENKEPRAPSTGSDTGNVNTATPKFAILRQYIPDDISDQVDDRYNNLSSKFHEESQRTFAVFYSTAQVEWEHMSKASRMLRSNGEYVPKRLEAADRSVDWLWENGRPADLVSSPSGPVVGEKMEPEFQPEFHHLSFQGYPVYHKSSTPAEVSLWLTQTSHKKYIFPDFSRQGVITAQATKLIDPFVYYGPDEVLEHSGTELRNAVVGLVGKAYVEEGTWLNDSYDDYDEVPTNADMVETYVWQHGDTTGRLQTPIWVTCANHTDMIVNDKKGQRATGSGPLAYTPSRLRLTAEREAAEVAAWEELRDGMLGMKPFLVEKLHFQAPTEEAVEEQNEGTYPHVLFHLFPDHTTNRCEAVPSEPGFDYKPVAKAVAQKAFQLAKWLVSSQFIW